MIFVVFLLAFQHFSSFFFPLIFKCYYKAAKSYYIFWVLLLNFPENFLKESYLEKKKKKES